MGDIAGTVFAAVARERPGRLAVAGIAALAAHLLLLAAMRGANVATATKPAGARAVAVAPRGYELDTSLLQPPGPIAKKAAKAASQERSAAPRVRAAAASRAPAAAGRAASVVAREPDPGAPVDLTGDAIVTGTATAYAGGLTTSAGISATAGRGSSPAGNAV